ncbi:TRAP transporter large permease subunit [Chloroflexota bacterium]
MVDVELSVGLITLIIFGGIMLMLFTGMPVAFGLGAVAIIFGLVFLGPRMLALNFYVTFRYATYYTLLALPMFTYMSNILGESGVAEDLYACFMRFIGFIRGGLAAATVGVCTVMAAMVGQSSTGVLTMGLIAYPEITTKYNYDKKLVAGTIGAGGALGILIPPSGAMIVYGAIAQESVVQLFAAGIIPGLILAGMFVAYILIRCNLQPKLGPTSPLQYTWREKGTSLKGLIMPSILIFGILGGIFQGVWTPTEASAIGALGAFGCAAVNRRLTWKVAKEATFKTAKLTAILMWIVFGSASISRIYTASGASHFIETMLVGGNLPTLAVIGIMQLILMFLGCFIDSIGITMITIPLFAPIVEALGLSKVWFGVLFIVNMEMGYLTPPFGFNLFLLRGILKPKLSMVEIYQAVLPYILIQALCLALILFFPQLALFLPPLITK